jgi:hypothetical protein
MGKRFLSGINIENGDLKIGTISNNIGDILTRDSSTGTVNIANATQILNYINAISNNTLNTHQASNLLEQRESLSILRNHYDYVVDDNGEIENYLYIGDFFFRKSGHVIREIKTSNGIITDIETDFIRVEDLPLIPEKKIIDNNLWSTLEW